MYIMFKGKKYKFNGKRLIKNIVILLGFILFMLIVGLAGSSDLASGIY